MGFMSKHIGFIFVCIIIISVILIFSSCTETIYEEVVKIDTVFINKPVQGFAPSFIIQKDTIVIEKEVLTVDTVEIQTVITETDTVFQVTTDTVYFETVVYKTDTIRITDTVKVVEQQTITETDTVFITQVDTVWLVSHVYTETQYLFPGNSVTYIPAELQPIVNQYYSDAERYGKTPTGGDIVIEFVNTDNLPGEGWTSNSFQMNGWQWIIQLDETLSPDRSFSCLYRELSRIQLNKKYSTRTGELLNPLFPVDDLKYSDSDAKKLPYLNKLFQ